VGGEVVADDVDFRSRLDRTVDLVQEVAEIGRCVLAGSLLMTLPVAMFRAANRSVVPCLW
jgi:hypothetical protein